MIASNVFRERESRLKQTIADLEAVDDWNDLILSKSKIGPFDWSLPAGQLYLSPAFKTLLGYEDHELAHSLDAWRRHIHPDDRANVIAKIEQAISDGSIEFESLHRMIHRDGSTFWSLIRAAVVRTDAGVPKRMVGAVIVVSDPHNLIA